MGAIRAVLDAIAELGYTYVLLDGPPALGDVPDAALLATACDQVLVVARLARISASDAIDLRERLDHIAVRPLGLAVIDPDAPVSSPYEPAARGGSAQLSRESVRP